MAANQSFIPLFEADDLVDISGIEKEPELDNTLEVERSGFGYSEFIKKLGSTEIPNTMSKSHIWMRLKELKNTTNLNFAIFCSWHIWGRSDEWNE